MALADLITRAGGVCEFCGASDALDAVDVPPGGEILLCPLCRDQVRDFEAAGGALLEEEPAAKLSPDAFARTLALIDAPGEEPAVPRQSPRSPGMPGPLARHDTGRWRRSGRRFRHQIIKHASGLLRCGSRRLGNQVVKHPGRGRSLPRHQIIEHAHQRPSVG